MDLKQIGNKQSAANYHYNNTLTQKLIGPEKGKSKRFQGKYPWFLMQ